MPDLFDPGVSGLDLPATTLTDIYTCPDNRAVKVTVLFCNRSGSNNTIRFSRAIDGALDNISQYLMYNVTVDPNSVIGMTTIALNSGDVLRAYAVNTGISVNVFIDEDQGVIG